VCCQFTSIFCNSRTSKVYFPVWDWAVMHSEFYLLFFSHRSFACLFNSTFLLASFFLFIFCFLSCFLFYLFLRISPLSYSAPEFVRGDQTGCFRCFTLFAVVLTFVSDEWLCMLIDLGYVLGRVYCIFLVAPLACCEVRLK